MKLDLKEIYTYYINLPQHTEKNKTIQTMFNLLNIKRVERLDGESYPENTVAGCSRAHYQALSKIKPPCVLFEDDAFVNQNLWNDGIIHIPDDADAVYLGNSTWGRMNGHNGEFIQYDIIENYPNVLRVYNMLTAHSILYLNKEYSDMIKRVAYHSGYIIEDYNDVGFAEMQRYFKVYAFDEPLFSQKSNEQATNKKITSINHTECMVINQLQFYPYPIK